MPCHRRPQRSGGGAQRLDWAFAKAIRPTPLARCTAIIESRADSKHRMASVKCTTPTIKRGGTLPTLFRRALIARCGPAPWTPACHADKCQAVTPAHASLWAGQSPSGMGKTEAVVVVAVRRRIVVAVCRAHLAELLFHEPPRSTRFSSGTGTFNRTVKRRPIAEMARKRCQHGKPRLDPRFLQ